MRIFDAASGLAVHLFRNGGLDVLDGDLAGDITRPLSHPQLLQIHGLTECVLCAQFLDDELLDFT